jgi:hypothetical protein
MTSTKPNPVVVNAKSYYDASALKIYDADYFHGTSRSLRDIIKRKKIPPASYVYAGHSQRKGWSLAADQSKPASKAKLMIEKKWVVDNMPNMSNKVVIQETPAIFELDDNEKFKDADGKPINIETCGERFENKIYFRAKHIADAFKMPRLIDNIKDSDTKYIVNEHYVIYNIIPHTMGESAQKNTSKKQVYLTYEGVLKVLYSSRSGNAAAFRSWATKILFTHQMGSVEQKEELSANVLGINVKSLRAVLNKSAVSLPCVYMFSLGLVKDLRESMKLDKDLGDNHIIIKYGLTDNLERRAAEHVREYGKIKGATLEILKFVHIDPKNLSDAEMDLKSFFHDIETPIKYEAYKELVAINPKHDKQIQKQFKYINTEFAGSIAELTNQIDTLKRELIDSNKQHTWELREKDLLHENTKKIIEVKNMEIEKQAVEIELLALKLSLKK